jgi:hypothetical protein
MKIQEVILTQVVRLMRVNTPSGAIYLPEAVKAMQERYGFLQVPKTLEEYNPTQGITFSHGKFKIPKTPKIKDFPEEIVIDKFQIFTDGILLQTRAHTGPADLFLDDLLQWAMQRFQLTYLSEPPFKRTYLSQLVVTLNVDLDQYVRNTSPLSKKIHQSLESYGQNAPMYEPSTFSIHYDLTQSQLFPAPIAFTIERKLQMPYKTMTYFSGAPLTTADHIAVLQLVEKSAKE